MMYRGQSIKERRFVDTLQVGTQTGGGRGSNPTAVTWTWDTTNTVQCLVIEGPPQQVGDGTEASMSDAKISVAASNTSVTNVKRVKVTHRYRTELTTAEIYEVLGQPKLGRDSKILRCKRVAGSSGL